MSNTRAPRRSREETLQLITECRQSGLSDAEWCKQHDIRISTFYSWIARLRKEACEVPAASYGHTLTGSPKQDVVKVDILPELPEPAPLSMPDRDAGMHLDNSHTIEIQMADIRIRLTNEASPALLGQTICALRSGLC